MVGSVGHALSRKTYGYDTGPIVLRLGTISLGKSSAQAGHLTASRLSAPPSLLSRLALALVLVRSCSPRRSFGTLRIARIGVVWPIDQLRQRQRLNVDVDAPGSTRTRPGDGYAQHRPPCGPTTTQLTLTPRLGLVRPLTAGSDTRAALAKLLAPASALPLLFTQHARSASPSANAPLRRTRPVNSQHPCRHPARSRRTTRPLVNATSRRDTSSAVKTDLGLSRIAQHVAGHLKRPRTVSSTSEKEFAEGGQQRYAFAFV
jgi:hypothetical protein